MVSIKKKFIATLLLVGLFSLTTFFVPSFNGMNNNDLNLTAQSTDSYVEDFTTTTYLDGASSAFGWGTGIVTNNRNFSLEFLDHYYTSSPVVDVEVQGMKAYLGMYNSSTSTQIAIVEISNPSDISLLGESSAWYETKAIAVEGDALWAGQYDDASIDYGIIAYDVQDPSNPHWVIGFGMDNYVTDIETLGAYIYYTSYNVADNTSLRVLYDEDPAGFETFPAKCNWECNLSLGLDIVGHSAYIAASTEGFYVLNITNKFSPVEIGYVNTPGNATDVIVDGGLAYLADGSAGVHVIDIRDPTNPTIISTYDTPGHAQRLVKQGRTLFVADGNGGVQVFDTFDPNHIAFVTEIASIPYAYDVDLYGENLVIATNDGIYTYKVGFLKNYDSFYSNVYDDHEVWDVKVIGDIAYIAGGRDGLITLNVRDPNNPILLDNDIIGVTPFYRKLDVRGNFAYIADYGNAFRIYDISDPANIFQTNFRVLGQATDVMVSGDYAFIADGTLGVYIYNISNPYVIPSPYSSFTVTSNVTALWIQGPLLYIVGKTGANVGLAIYDITDISTPVEIYKWDLINVDHYDVYVDGDSLFLVDQLGYYEHWDVTDPTSTGFGDYISTSSKPSGVWGFGPYMLVADHNSGVTMINTSDITDIQKIGNCPNATLATQISTSGDFTYVANRTSLVILRHFESAADTYVLGTSEAQSLEVDNTEDIIYRATLDFVGNVPTLTAVEFSMSADGGTNWEVVTPGLEHVFANPGNDLRWKAVIAGPEDRSVHLYAVSIDYFFNEQPTAPLLNDPGVLIEVSNVEVTWNTSTDDVGIDHYELQVANETNFATPIDTFIVTGLSHNVTDLTDGTYYFRVRAVDDYDLASDWSDTVDIQIDTSGISLPWWAYVIIGGGLVGIILVVVITLLVRKKKIATR